MASRQGIKNRIKSVSNTKQITKAMQLVAASKLKKAQDAAIAPREYLAEAKLLVQELAATTAIKGSSLFEKKDSIVTLTIVVSSDRGLAGAYNSNVVRAMTKHLKDGSTKHKIISIGRYASLFVAKINGPDDVYNIEEVEELAAYPIGSVSVDQELSIPILQEAVDLFNANKVGEVFVVYTEFNSTVKQTVKIEKILPLEANAESTVKLQKTTEPSGPEMVDFVANRYLEAALTQYILESLASEHASRMLAMKNATDNAGDLIDDLTLASNNARQAAITQELAEISAGAAAVN
jgi:F-type H+-transporting ATPase subunit gamma